MINLLKNLKNGLLTENPVFVLLLGLCPTLAVSTSIDNAFGMTAAVMFVLISANIIVSLIRGVTPDRVRIPVFIVIIASLVTIVDLSMKAFMPDLSKSLGIFIPLIVVNCIILGRAEAFASKNTLADSIADAFGMGIGFGLAITIISFFRQLLGTGEITVFGTHIFSAPGLFDNPMSVFILPMGAFLVLGCLLATLRYIGVIESG
ncbi:electron transport complex subunit RsxE [Thermoplasmatales archaeon ex4572_165]|nr:MAG: electron transport complex subunit RsxE [Thermoplasmatales archaeon ex4572_165]RLF59098.1 MAG: electron transport complex subunit RsxE [Thermoplasmata archaeon]